MVNQSILMDSIRKYLLYIYNYDKCTFIRIILDIERYHHHKLIFVSHETRKRGMWSVGGVWRPTSGGATSRTGTGSSTGTRGCHTHTPTRERKEPTPNEYTNERIYQRTNENSTVV